MDLEKLKAAMQANIEKGKESVTMLHELQGKTDEESGTKAKALQGLIQDNKDEFETLKGQLSEAKEMSDRTKVQLELEEMMASKAKQVGTTTLPAGSPSDSDEGDKDNEGDEVLTLKAKAIDWAGTERLHRDAFVHYLRGKNVDEIGEGRRLLIPKRNVRTGTDDEERSKSVVIPRTLVSLMLGSNIAHLMMGNDADYGAVMGAHGEIAEAAKTIFSVATPAAGYINPSAGQSLVPQDFRPALQMLPLDVPTLLDFVTIVPSTTGQVTWPVLTQTDADGNEFAGVSFSWISEGAAKSETEPLFEQRVIATHELAGYTEISERMLSRSAIQLEAFLGQLFRGALRWALDRAIIVGTGTGEPSGIVTAAGVRRVARNTAGAVTWDDLVNLEYAVKQPHRGGGRYVLDDTVEQNLKLSVDTFGRPLFTQSMANTIYDRLNGRPFHAGTNTPDLGARGDVIFGNMGVYVLVMEEEITMARSDHVGFRRNVVTYKMFLVAGGRPMHPRGLAILDGTTTS